MKGLLFYFTVPILYFFSILPFQILYFVSDVFIFPILFYVVGYRRKVVKSNLKSSFPEKTEKERSKIEKEFYKYLSDLFVEIIKMFTISEKSLRKRITYDHKLTIDKWYDEGRSFVLTLGHYGNYEWVAQSLGWAFPHQGAGPYHKMSNDYFNSLFFKARSKFGTEMFSTKETGRFLRTPKPRPFIVALANDQSAPPTKSFWTTFLNQDTSFFLGTEKIAKDLNMPVVFATTNRVSRGKYHVSLEVITEEPKKEKDGEILEKHAKLLEESIISKPSQWLWTHRRWKHKKPENIVQGFSRPE